MAKAKPTAKITRKNGIGSKKWRSLTHKGPQFYPPFKRLGCQLFKYNKKAMTLSKRSEEVALMYAQYLMRKNRPKKLEKRLQKNFFEDWQNKYMTASERKVIVNFAHCDFSRLVDHLTTLSEKKKTRSATLRAKERQFKEILKNKYQFFNMNGRKEQINNFMVEPPGLYMGRGDNKNIGKIKARIEPKDVILNCGTNCRPKPPPGTHWKAIFHDQTKTWLACWQDSITGKMKYIWPHASSVILSMRDQEKYDKAIELKRRINGIRKRYRRDLSSSSLETSQHATAVYLIDKMALRAGNEKSHGEADTVGCSTLRVEHVKPMPNRLIRFNFHGKDSVPYRQDVVLIPKVYANIAKFIKKKSKKELIFDQISSKTLNDYLGKMMDGLTAKVFRTFQATECYEANLKQFSTNLHKDDKRELKLAHIKANLEVAKLLNHVTMTKTSQKSRRECLKKHSLKVEKVKQKYELLRRKRPRPDSEEFKEKKGLRIQAEELKMREAKQQFALGTSLVNYIDPRVVKGWCVKFDVDTNKVYSKTQQTKFRWAIETARQRQRR